MNGINILQHFSTRINHSRVECTCSKKRITFFNIKIPLSPGTRSVFNNSSAELVSHRDSSTKVKPCGSGSSLDRCWSSVTHSWTASSRSADHGSGMGDPSASPANEGKRSNGGRLSQSPVNALLSGMSICECG
ncbi:hypothetical protein NPIL_233751 [Nephila pilipes]|uniref:Uncharacterized protein n=1 Tax=Nephila pilipes TaxID=299642 RepID=A0A8X6PSP3_NEPPI|nr:hypothetical protein NPIL_233751 [Nephila pilipes]